MSPAPAQALRATLLALCALTATELAWEAWLAPLKPGGSWFVLKSLPLAAFVPFVARGGLRSLQWLLLALPWYFIEAVVRTFADAGRARACAATALVLCCACIVCALVYVRTLRARPAAA